MKKEVIKHTEHNQFIKKQMDMIIDTCFEAINEEGEYYDIDSLIKKLKLVKKGMKKGLVAEQAVKSFRF